MAIGDVNGGNSNYQQNSGRSTTYEPTYYSRIRFQNDDLRLSINYRSGLMIINIEKQGMDKPVSQMFLSPMKAHMLANQIKNMLAYKEAGDIDPNKAFGVTGGMNEKISFIGFSVEEDNNIAITIGKFDGSGTITESNKFKLSVDYNYAIEWNNIITNDIVKVYDNEAELTLLSQAIEDFARNMTGSAGYAMLDLNRYEAQKEYRRIDQIFDKLGIERRTYGGGNHTPVNNNFLNNASSRSTSMDDIMDNLLED